MRYLMMFALMASPLAGQQLDWQVREVLRFSDAPPDIAFGRIADVAVDSGGAIYVLDPMNGAIYAFRPDGRHVRTIGRDGAGPGELSGSALQMALRGDTIAVVDLGNQRVSRFRTDGTFLDDFRVTLEHGAPMDLALLPGGEIVLQRIPTPLPPALAAQIGGGGTAALFRHDRQGTVRDTLFVFRHEAPVSFDADGTLTTRIPDVMPVWGLDGQGRIVVGHSDRYQLRTWDGRAFGAPWGRRIGRQPVTREVRARYQQAQDSLRARLPANAPVQLNRRMILPDSLPVLWSVTAGPFGTTLVGRPAADPADDRGASVWDVFGPDRRFLGALRLPPGFRLITGRADRLYGVALDEDELSYLVVYAIAR